MTMFRADSDERPVAQTETYTGSCVVLGDLPELGEAETLLDLLGVPRGGPVPTRDFLVSCIDPAHRSQWLRRLDVTRTSAVPSVMRHGLARPAGDVVPALTTFVPFLSGGRPQGVYVVVVDLAIPSEAATAPTPSRTSAPATSTAGESIHPRAVPPVGRPAHVPASQSAARGAPTVVAGRSGESNSHLSALITHTVASAAASITVADVTQPDAPLVYVNAAFEEVTGYSADEVLGRNCRFLQGPGTDSAIVAAIRDAIANRSVISAVLRNYRRDGSEWLNHLSLAPVRGRDGSVSHYIGYQLDVSDGPSFD